MKIKYSKSVYSVLCQFFQFVLKSVYNMILGFNKMQQLFSRFYKNLEHIFYLKTDVALAQDPIMEKFCLWFYSFAHIIIAIHIRN